MPNLVMDFLQMAHPFVSTGVDVANAVGNTEARIAQDVGYKGPIRGPQTVNQQFGNTIGNYAGPDSPRSFASNVAQVGVSVLAPAISRPVEALAEPLINGATDIGSQVAGRVGAKIIGGAAKGVVGGAAVGGANAVAAGAGTTNNPKNLALDFLQGAKSGAEQGGVFGAASAKGSGTLNAAAASGGVVGSLTRKIITGSQAARTGLTDDDGSVGDYKNSQDLVKDYAKMLKGIDSDATGGQKIPDGEGGYKRTTEHSQFYSQYYAENGRAPSNAAWQAEAQRQLESGRAAYGASDIYNTLVQKEGSISDETAASLAKETDSGKVEKQLTPTTGPVVAKDVAPAVAMTNDPNVAKNIVANDLSEKTAPAEPDLSKYTDDQLHKMGFNVPGGMDAKTAAYIPTEDINGNPTQPYSYNEQLPGMEQGTPPASIPEPTATDNINTPQTVSAEEESLYNSQPENIPEQKPLREFMNAPGEEAKGVSGVSHLQTLQEMHAILQNSGIAGDALAHYMEKNPGATYTDAQDALSELRNSEGFENGKLNSSLNPRYEEGRELVGSKIPEGDTNSVMTKTRMAHNAIMREGTKAIIETRKLGSDDLSLMDEARDKTPQQVGELADKAKDPAQFLRAYQAVKNYDDFAQGIGSGGLGQDVAYRQNHLLSKYMMSPEDEAKQSQLDLPEGEEQPTNQGRAKQPTRPGYAQGRNGGGIPQNENFLQDLEQDVGVKSQHIAQLTFSKSLGEAFPDQVAQGNLPAGYSQVKLPFAKGVSVPNDIADELNSRAPVNTKGLLKGYDTINSVMKNLKLGGGLFHSVNVAGTFIGQQIASGKLFSHPQDAASVIKATFSDDAMDDKMSELDKQGMLRASDRLGLEYNKFGVQADIGSTSKLDNIPLLKQIHESTFGRQIPMMKLLTLQQKLTDAGIDPKNMSDEDIKTGTKLAKEINNNYGGINRMIQGLTPGQFKVASRVLLATDYTEGQLKTLADAFSKGGVDGRLAREAVIGKALLFAGVATAAGALGGEFKGQTSKQIAGDIIYKTINPKFQFGGYTVGLPETQLSEFAKPVAESIADAKNGDNASGPLKDFLTARLAALPSEANQLATNRNYEGNPIHGTDYYGRPISTGQTIANTLSGLVPIPASEAAQTATGQQSIGESIANTAGLETNPTYPLSYAPVAGQTYIQELEQTPGVPKQQISKDTMFFNLLEKGSHGKDTVIQQAEAAIAQKKPQVADKIISNYNQKLLESLLPWQKSGGTVYLDTTMLSLLKTAEITYKKANENVAYDVKTNPTAYGVPIAALAQTPQTVSSNQIQGV
jgi:hypothetical protein